MRDKIHATITEDTIKAIKCKKLNLASHLLLKNTKLNPKFFRQLYDYIKSQPDITQEFTFIANPNYVLKVPIFINK